MFKFQMIFKGGSTTFYNSSIFFPSEMRQQVATLYAFVRTADNFVDVRPQKKDEFRAFVEDYHQARQGGSTSNEVISEFIELSKNKSFADEWVDSFLNSMSSDIDGHICQTLEDTLQYVHGSAEVIGLMMAAIMDLPRQSHEFAAKLGRAFQYINFIRDIDHDNALNRIYLPLAEVKSAGLSGLEREEAIKKPEAFNGFILEQIKRYRSWQKEASQGYEYLPKKFLVPIKTAADMYAWTADQIEINPQIVFDRIVKPDKFKVIGKAIHNYFKIKNDQGIHLRGQHQDKKIPG